MNWNTKHNLSCKLFGKFRITKNSNKKIGRRTKFPAKENFKRKKKSEFERAHEGYTPWNETIRPSATRATWSAMKDSAMRIAIRESRASLRTLVRGLRIVEITRQLNHYQGRRGDSTTVTDRLTSFETNPPLLLTTQHPSKETDSNSITW